MWHAGWARSMTATSAATTVVVAALAVLALKALYLPIQRRRQHPQIAAQIPFAAYLSFDLSVRFRRYVLSKGGVSSKLTKIPDVDVLVPGIIRILGKNPSRMTLQGTNTYLLGEGPNRVLIDASDGNLPYIDTLLRVCESHGVTEITDLVITHGHSDHIGGILHLREAFPLIKMWKFMPPHGDDKKLRYKNAECETLLVQPLSEGQTFQIPGTKAVLRTEYMPGHCADHVCFVLDDTKTKQTTLFSGDCILGEGSCVFDSLKDLMASLHRLRAINPRIIYPAHGPVVTDAIGKIEEYITHRQQREDELLRVLTSTEAALSSKELVQKIYEKLPFLLQLAARKSVEKHLDKLLLEKRVVKASSSWLSGTTYRLAKV
ncbi:hypothetical protein Poli38472_000329 [Pythium oligandrum]|uniref:Metallo-beta-lactamase domain-containing protein n=1 Tax=Pythium oligandrum TaxID=41045 RepID=A0A8K1FI00_PYTOL|nr:hypothetical protein Poli38472_000329 [Pythium oligandrum]|eukprot:TMW60287.1 hypothetical protein Poli38472_000329 [Pythium oligandrum]